MSLILWKPHLYVTNDLVYFCLSKRSLSCKLNRPICVCQRVFIPNAKYLCLSKRHYPECQALWLNHVINAHVFVTLYRDLINGRCMSSFKDNFMQYEKCSGVCIFPSKRSLLLRTLIHMIKCCHLRYIRLNTSKYSESLLLRTVLALERC